MTASRIAAFIAVWPILLASGYAGGAEDGPDPEAIRSHLDGHKFQQAISRCGGDGLTELTLVIKVEADGSAYLVGTAPDDLPNMTVSCLASEVLKYQLPSSDARYRFSYAVVYLDDGSMHSTVDVERVHPVESWEPVAADGRTLLAKGLIVNIVGDIFLTVAVALFPRLYIDAQSKEECSSTEPCGPSGDVWLAFDIVGMAAGFVAAIVGASMMQVGWAKRKMAFDTSSSGLSFTF